MALKNNKKTEEEELPFPVDEPTRRWNTLIVTAFKENREAVEEWMESMKLYSDSASANTFEHGITIEEHDIDIEKSYIKHLEALTDL